MLIKFVLALQRETDGAVGLEKEIGIVEGSVVDRHRATEKGETEVRVRPIAICMQARVHENNRISAEPLQITSETKVVEVRDKYIYLLIDIFVFRSPQRGRHGRSRYIVNHRQVFVYCGTFSNRSPRGDGYKQRSYGDRLERNSHTDVKEDDDGIW